MGISVTELPKLQKGIRTPGVILPPLQITVKSQLVLPLPSSLFLHKPNADLKPSSTTPSAHRPEAAERAPGREGEEPGRSPQHLQASSARGAAHGPCPGCSCPLCSPVRGDLPSSDAPPPLQLLAASPPKNQMLLLRNHRVPGDPVSTAHRCGPPRPRRGALCGKLRLAPGAHPEASAQVATLAPLRCHLPQHLRRKGTPSS